MIRKIFPPLLSVCTLFIFFIACNEVNTSGPEQTLFGENTSYETIDSDLSLLKESGMPLDDAAGVFSISWNDIFRPLDYNSEITGTAFAVAFGEENNTYRHFQRFGLDMGSVFIDYAEHQIEMNKRINDRLGTAYTIFRYPFGHSDQVLEFIPDTEYNFEVTGSDYFAPITITLLSPAALMDITSHSNADIIDPTKDLTITWEGGNDEGKVAVRLIPFNRRIRGIRGDRGSHHFPHFDRIIFEVLESNSGTYSFTSNQLQRVLEGIDTRGIIIGVSQMDIGEVTHENGVLYTAMRNGDNVVLRIGE